MKIIYKHDDWEYDRENLEYMLLEETLQPNCEKRIDLHAYFAERDPFEFDAKYDNPFWSADV